MKNAQKLPKINNFRLIFSYFNIFQIPRQWNEVDCRRLFEAYGSVYSCNILRDKSTQTSKGCCFVTFFHRKDAIEAQGALHNIKVIDGMHHPVQMKPADTENRNERKLFIGQLSKKHSEENLREIFSKFGQIEDCSVLRDNDGKSRGCAFVTFTNRSCAVVATKEMHHSQTMEGCSAPLVVKFADTQKDKDVKTKSMISAGNAGGGGSPKGAAANLMQNLNPALLQQLGGGQNYQAVASLLSLIGQPGQQQQQQNVLGILGSVLSALGKLTESDDVVSSKSTSPPEKKTSPPSSSHHHHLNPTSSGASATSTTTVSSHHYLQQQQQLGIQETCGMEHVFWLFWNFLRRRRLLNSESASRLNFPPENLKIWNFSFFPCLMCDFLVACCILGRKRVKGAHQLLPQPQSQFDAITMAQIAHQNQMLALQGFAVQQGAPAQQQQGMAGGLAGAKTTSPVAATLANHQQMALTPFAAGGAAALDHFQAMQQQYALLANLQATSAAVGVPSAVTSTSGAGQLIGNGDVRGPDGANLFIYHLPQDFGDTDLINTFAPFGVILSAKVFIDKVTNLSKCYGFVSFENPQSATNAISAMNGFQIGSKRLKVQLKVDRGHPYSR
ncbi:CRE-ETR-1 protein [Caenorhabditis remanei]|uniref:CRE-ETR-1 protein n=1 Tax=Caenorhabditis remanei TaxID=31234 RepID=E3NLN8_CAERE|nr:CRE-ETR-1 protein [Caenorhabditis remanei]